MCRECWRVTQCASSHPLTPANWPKLQHSHQSLKQHVRCGVGPAARKEFWLGQLLVTEDDSVMFAKAFGEPTDGEQSVHYLFICKGLHWLKAYTDIWHLTCEVILPSHFIYTVPGAHRMGRLDVLLTVPKSNSVHSSYNMTVV